MDDLGGKPPIFGNTQMYEHVKLAIDVESEYNSARRKEKQWIHNRPNKQSEALFLKNADHLKNMWWIQSSYHKIVTSPFGEGRRAHWMWLKRKH